MPTRIYSFTCEACGNSFQRKTIVAQFCGVDCRNKVLSAKRSWQRKEDQALLALIGRYQPRQIIQKWNEEATRRDWKQRSSQAIRDRITKLCKSRGISSRSVTDNWTGSNLARLLDISRDRVDSWLSRGLLVERHSYEGEVYKGAVIIKRKNLVDFALARPDLFHSIAIPKLNKVLRNKEAIALIRQVNIQPLNHRGCAVVRLDNGRVYPSAVDAERETGISSKAILYNIKEANKPMLNGSDWARVEYPVYAVPLAVRAIFSIEAGRIFYLLYCDLIEIEGSSKRDVLVVAIRQAVQITMMSFRRQWRESEKEIKITPLEEIQKFWRDRFIKNIQKFYGQSESNCWYAVNRTIKQQAYELFVGRKKYELDEFALWLNQKYGSKFEKEYIPVDYKPRSRLEKADFFAFIYQLLFAWVDIGKKRIPLTTLMFLNYSKYFLLPPSTEYSEAYLFHNEDFSYSYQLNEELSMDKQKIKDYIIAAVYAAQDGDNSAIDMIVEVLEKQFNQDSVLNEEGAAVF